ncbi:MAG: hypothetical protein GX119_09170 [Syntrophomonadaceae bacterium]|jgi:uncharacterized membrane protein YkvI|nr:hypothetical protein [Syntrophomonadaceae bacterium]
MGYLGAVVGAGFASGQETVQFFVSHGKLGIKGCLLAMFLFACCGALLMYIAHLHKINSYQDMLKELLGEKHSKIFDLLIAVFLFLGLSIMLSASGAIFSEHLSQPKEAGILIAALLAALFLCSGKNGLVKSFNILVPVKLACLLIITGYAALVVKNEPIAAYTALIIPQPEGGWIIASILYVAYNFALAMVILTEYQSLGSRRDGIWGGILGGTILGILIVFNYLALIKFMPMVLHYEVPMLYVAGFISPIGKVVYTLVLWVGILTTAIANAYGFAQRFCHFTGISYGLSLVLTLILALPIAWQSFSVLVSKVYPLFGLLGIIILLVLVAKAGREIGAEIKAAFFKVD